MAKLSHQPSVREKDDRRVPIQVPHTTPVTDKVIVFGGSVDSRPMELGRGTHKKQPTPKQKKSLSSSKPVLDYLQQQVA